MREQTSFIVDGDTLSEISKLKEVFGVKKNSEVIKLCLALGVIASKHFFEDDGNNILRIEEKNGNKKDIILSNSKN